MMYTVKFELFLLGALSHNITASKVQEIPFLPEEGDSFWIESDGKETGMFKVHAIAYNLTNKQIRVRLRGDNANYSSWAIGSLVSTVDVKCILDNQGWDTRFFNPN